MSDNIGKVILLVILVVIGIAAFVYIGIPLITWGIIIAVKLIWWIAALLADFVKIAVFLILLVAIIIAVYTFIKWLVEKQTNE